MTRRSPRAGTRRCSRRSPHIPSWTSSAAPTRQYGRTPPPSWIPSDYLAVLGDMDSSRGEHPYGPDFGGILKGGNAVIRRTTLQHVGPYAEYLGPAGPARLLSCEDEEMYLRLVSSGARGLYLPTPPRLSPHLRRSSDAGIFPALVLLARGLTRPDGPGSPDAGALPGRRASFPLRLAARGLARVAKAVVAAAPERSALSDELKAWDLGGLPLGTSHLHFGPIFAHPEPQNGSPTAAANP